MSSSSNNDRNLDDWLTKKQLEIQSEIKQDREIKLESYNNIKSSLHTLIMNYSNIFYFLFGLSFSVLKDMFPNKRSKSSKDLIHSLKKQYSNKENVLRNHVEEYYMNIIFKPAFYEKLLGEKYQEYFYKYWLEHKDEIYRCDVDYFTKYNSEHIKFQYYDDNNKLSYYPFKIACFIMNSDFKKNKVVLENTKTNEIHSFIYDASHCKWKYKYHHSIYLHDFHIYKQFIFQNIVIGSVIQIVDTPILSVSSHLKNILQRDVTVYETNIQEGTIVCTYKWLGNKQKTFFDLSKQLVIKGKTKIIDTFFLTFKMQYYSSMNSDNFTLNKVEIVEKNSEMKEESKELKYCLKDLCIPETELIQHYIERKRFDQSVKWKQFNTENILAPFYGTGILEIMGSFLGSK